MLRIRGVVGGTDQRDIQTDSLDAHIGDNAVLQLASQDAHLKGCILLCKLHDGQGALIAILGKDLAILNLRIGNGVREQTHDGAESIGIGFNRRLDGQCRVAMAGNIRIHQIGALDRGTFHGSEYGAVAGKVPDHIGLILGNGSDGSGHLFHHTVRANDIGGLQAGDGAFHCTGNIGAHEAVQSKLLNDAGGTHIAQQGYAVGIAFGGIEVGDREFLQRTLQPGGQAGSVEGIQGQAAEPAGNGTEHGAAGHAGDLRAVGRGHAAAEILNGGKAAEAAHIQIAADGEAFTGEACHVLELLGCMDVELHITARRSFGIGRNGLDRAGEIGVDLRVIAKGLIGAGDLDRLRGSAHAAVLHADRILGDDLEGIVVKAVGLGQILRAYQSDGVLALHNRKLGGIMVEHGIAGLGDRQTCVIVDQIIPGQEILLHRLFRIGKIHDLIVQRITAVLIVHHAVGVDRRVLPVAVLRHLQKHGEYIRHIPGQLHIIGVLLYNIGIGPAQILAAEGAGIDHRHGLKGHIADAGDQGLPFLLADIIAVCEGAAFGSECGNGAERCRVAAVDAAGIGGNKAVLHILAGIPDIAGFHGTLVL